jgi:cytochrome c oxidase subunit 2
VRGTEARGAIGPDLTHVGSRLSLAAGRLENDVAAFERWVAHPGDVKPGVQMPAFDVLPRDELRALAAYLKGLD